MNMKAPITWRPILVGGIFNTVNPSVYQFREAPVPAKASYLSKDLKDWSDFYGLKILFPPSVFPVAFHGHPDFLTWQMHGLVSVPDSPMRLSFP